MQDKVSPRDEEFEKVFGKMWGNANDRINFFASAVDLNVPKQPEPETPRIIRATEDFDRSSYLILPGHKHETYAYPAILVQQERSLQGNSFLDIWNYLITENSFMITIRQFIDLIEHLKSRKVRDGNGILISSKRVDQILDDIFGQRDPTRTEFLDAKFIDTPKGIDVIYHMFWNNKFQPITEPLLDYITEKKITPGIDMEYWLKHATPQGMPSSSTPPGENFYWPPKPLSVACFRAGLDGVYLDCGGSLIGCNSNRGVRRAKIMER